MAISTNYLLLRDMSVSRLVPLSVESTQSIQYSYFHISH